MRVIYAPLGVPLYVIVQCAVCHIVRHVVQDVVGLPLLRLPLCRVTTVSGYHIVGHTACCIVHNTACCSREKKADDGYAP